jgi:hypothetical protein
MAKLRWVEWGERSGSGGGDDTALWPDSLHGNLPVPPFSGAAEAEATAGLPAVRPQSNIVPGRMGGLMLRSLDRRDACIAPMVVLTLGTPLGIPVTVRSWRALTQLVLWPKQWVH